MIIRCVVACRESAGAADFYACNVDLPEDEYDVGTHYEMAEAAAENEGYVGSMVSFDENDGPDWLFLHFNWDEVDTIADELEDD
jgi:hypothetical protein